MSEWFFVSAWLEKLDTEIHFEIANEDGEQYFFFLKVELVNWALACVANSALDRFYYAEEDMLALATSILDEEMIEDPERVCISQAMFKRYFSN